MAAQDWIDDLNPFDDGAEGQDPFRHRKSEEEWIEEWASSFTPGLWVCANGEKKFIEHMDTDHMINCAAFLWRKGMILRVRSPRSPVLPDLRFKLKEFLRAIEHRTQDSI